MFSDIELNITKGCFFSREKYIDKTVQIASIDFYHIILFKSECICQINFASYKVSENNVMFLGLSDSFFCEEQEMEMVSFSFNKEIFEQDYCKTENLLNGLLFNNLFQNFILELSINMVQKLQTKINRVINYIDKSDHNKSTLFFKEIILQLLILKHRFVVDENQSLCYYKIAYQYLSLINQHFRMEHNVFIYAKILRVQPKFLTKVFLDLKIENPKHFLNKRILLATKGLLINTTDTASSISYDVGFNEPAYFNRFFKKNTGLTTKQFRKTKEYSLNGILKKKNVQ